MVRVTVSLPDDVRDTAQRAADEMNSSFSSVVTQALTAWSRGRLVDEWLADYQAEFGAFSETELRESAERAGIPYQPPGRPGSGS